MGWFFGTAYPRFKRHFTTKELAEIYTPTKAEIAFAYNTTKGQGNIFNLIVVLKAFQRLGYFLKLSDIPHPIVNHIRSCLKLPTEIVLGYDNSKTIYRHRAAIREYLKINTFDKIARHLAVVRVYESASVMDNPADLEFLHGIRQLKYHAIVGVRVDRKLVDGRILRHLHKRGQQVWFVGLNFPVTVS